ncbi:MAG: hypothetical protein ACP5JE_03855 [Thermoplasmata archaeon]
MDWDYRNFHVQEDIDSGEFISSETTLVAAGPPTFASSTMVLTGIGVVDSFAVTQSTQVQRIFEIGSKLAYLVPGRRVGTITIARFYYGGPSLLSMLYASNTVNVVSPDNGNVEQSFKPVSTNKAPRSEKIDVTLSPGFAWRSNSAPTASQNSGFSGFNLWSDLFDHPTGLLVFFKTSYNVPVGGMYFEGVLLSGHQFSLSAAMILVAEGVSAEFEIAVPVDVSAIPASSIGTVQAPI